MAPVARVAVEKTTCRFDKLFDYAIPQGMPLRPGVRVLVPFGHGRRIGLVVELAEQAAHAALKPIAAPLEEEPVLTEEGLFLLRWLRENTFCTWFDALSVLIPAGYGLRGLTGWSLVRGAPVPEDLSLTEQQVLSVLRPRRKPLPAADLAETLGLTLSALPLDRLEALGLLRREEVVERRVGDKTLQMVRLTEAEPEKLTPKQQQVYELLGQVGCGSIREVCYFAGVTRGVVEKLVQQGLAETYEQEVLRTPLKEETIPVEPPPTLTEEQAAAVETLWQGCREGGRTGLLYGVTGSGKTAVYLTLAHRVLAEGRRCIVLVPEISLTPQTIRRFLAAFGSRVAVIHSALSLSERLDEYKRIRRGEVDVVLGTRSALFAPLKNLGLIIMDEEQEGSYQSENVPRYDAREVAKYLCVREKAALVFGSATPTVETAWAVEQGSYQKALLRRRYNENALPEVLIADLRQEILNGNPGLISTPLRQELEKNLAALNARFGASADFYAKRIELYHCPGAIVLFDNMASLESLWSLLLDAATRHTPSLEPERMPHSGTQVYELLMHHSGLPAEDSPVKDMDDLIRRMTAGMAVLLLDGCKKGLVFSVQGLKSRSVEEPSGEGNLRGSREGFADLLRVNLSLLRRLIRTDTLVMETAQADCAMKTEYAICYCKDKASKTAVARIRRTLQEAKPEGLLDSSYFVPWLFPARWRLFAPVSYTERPASAAAKLCEGKIIILVNGSPSALVLPSLFCENFDCLDDYATTAVFSSFLRVLKYGSFYLSIFLPGVFVCLAVYLPELIPPQLLFKIAAAEKATPLPLFAEMLLVIILLEIIREAGLRMPQTLGHSVSLVAALIIGDAAIGAGLLSTPVILVASITAISVFVTPSLYEPATLLRLGVTLAAGLAGPVGLVCAALGVLAALTSISAMGVPYLSGAVFSGDGVVRRNYRTLSRRPFTIWQRRGS